MIKHHLYRQTKEQMGLIATQLATAVIRKTQQDWLGSVSSADLQHVY